jgi:hypothetical protein
VQRRPYSRLVIAAPPNCGGPGVPQRASMSSLTPSGALRTIGAGQSGKTPGSCRSAKRGWGCRAGCIRPDGRYRAAAWAETTDSQSGSRGSSAKAPSL